MVPCSLPELGPHQVPGEAVWHLYSHVTQRPEPRPGFRWGSLQRSPAHWLVGKGWVPHPQEPHPRTQLFGPRL